MSEIEFPDDGSSVPLPPNRSSANQDRDPDEASMKKLVQIAIPVRLPQEGYDAINALKNYGPKAIPHLLEIANRAISFLVRRRALRAVSEL